MESSGREYFRSFSANPEGKKIIVKDFSLSVITPLVYDAPDEAMTYLQQHIDEIPKENRQVVEQGLKSFISGMGNEALDMLYRKEGGHPESVFWKTAINASDITTEGGIGANESMQIKLGNAIDSARERVEIAQYIMEKINGRTEATQQTTNPQRIPPEQRTPPEYAADDPRRANVGGQEEHPADLRPAPPQDSEPQV